MASHKIINAKVNNDKIVSARVQWGSNMDVTPLTAMDIEFQSVKR